MYGLDPDPERVRVAALAWGKRGQAVVGAAPELPQTPQRIDLALMLDMAHHLTGDGLLTTLKDLHTRLQPDGRLVMRVIVPTGKKWPWEQTMEVIRFRYLGIGRPRYRGTDELTKAFETAGFQVETIEPTAKGREETWVIARLTKKQRGKDT